MKISVEINFSEVSQIIGKITVKGRKKRDQNTQMKKGSINYPRFGMALKEVLRRWRSEIHRFTASTADLNRFVTEIADVLDRIEKRKRKSNLKSKAKACESEALAFVFFGGDKDGKETHN